MQRPTVKRLVVSWPLVPAVILMVAGGGHVLGGGQVTESASTEPPLETILLRMAETDRTATQGLLNYGSLRRYTLENKRFGKKASMTVRLSFRFPGQKQFDIISEEGSATVRKRVFRRMLEAESKTSHGDLRNSTQIAARNYVFEFKGTEVLEGRRSFVLDAVPKTRNKFLFRGRIWVDADDYAIALIQGTPAQNPSFWIRKTSFVHRYRKFGRFWLPVSNRSETEALIFGRTDVSIEYSDYVVNQLTELDVAEGGH